MIYVFGAHLSSVPFFEIVSHCVHTRPITILYPPPPSSSVVFLRYFCWTSIDTSHGAQSPLRAAAAAAASRSRRFHTEAN